MISASLKSIVIALVLSLSFGGCASLGGDQLNDILATKAGRTARLKQRVEDFHRLLYWGSVEEAAAYVHNDVRRELVPDMANARQKEKLVDLSLEFIDWRDDEDQAVVDVRVRYYPIPSYVIESRIDQETWQFDRFGGGWFLKARTVKEEYGKDSFQIR